VNNLLPVIFLAALATVNAQTIRSYHVGNSLTDGFLYHADFKKLVESARPDLQLETGAHLIWGTQLSYLWKAGQPAGDESVGKFSKRGNLYGQTGDHHSLFYAVFPEIRLDYLTVQAFNNNAPSDLEHASYFINLLKTNPANFDADGKIATQVVLFTKWPSREKIEDAHKKVIGLKPFDFSAEWVNPDVSHRLKDATDSPDDDYRAAVPGHVYSPTATQDYQNDLARVMTDPGLVGQVDPAKSGTQKLALPSEVQWGKDRATLAVAHPATFLAKPIRLAPVGDAFFLFDQALRAEVDELERTGMPADEAIVTVEKKYGLENTADMNPSDETVFNNLGDRNFAEHLYKDGIHQTPPGQYLQALVLYATLFQTNPKDVAPAAKGFQATGAFIDLAREIAWKAVTNHPLSGVNPG
jgi:hypothetical protein